MLLKYNKLKKQIHVHCVLNKKKYSAFFSIIFDQNAKIETKKNTP